MTLGTVSTSSWTFPNIQVHLCVILVQFHGKSSCATYVMGAGIFWESLSYSLYKTTWKLPGNTTL